MGYLQFGLFAILAFATFKTGESLRCWSCSSDMDAPCADYFNTTQYQRYGRYPQNNVVTLQDCDQSTSQYYSGGTQLQKAVCMKKKQTTYGRTTYIRQCRFLHFEEKVGTCPSETTNSAVTVDFCEYCDHDGCNGASSLQKTLFLSAALPFLVFLLFRK